MNQDFFGKMTNGEKGILGGSVIVLIALFLPWYGWDLNFGFLGSNSYSWDGFHSWGWLTFLALLAVVGFWVIRTFMADDVKLPEMGLEDPALYMIGGAVEVVGAVLFWITATPDVGAGYFSAGAKFGVFLAIVGGAVTILGGYLKQSEPQAVTTTGGGGASSAASGPPQSFTPASYTPPQPPQPQFTTPPPPPTGPPSAPPPPSAPTAQPPESAPPEG